MIFSFDGVIVWFTGGDWRIVRGTIRVKSLLEAEESTISKKDIIELLVRRACT
jgi:hypothetical protein